MGFYVLDPTKPSDEPLGAVQTADSGFGRIISIGVSDPSETKGPKINGLTYKNKTNNRRRWGHRQRYSTIEITGISKG